MTFAGDSKSVSCFELSVQAIIFLNKLQTQKKGDWIKQPPFPIHSARGYIWFRCGRVGQCAVYLLSNRFQILPCVWFMAARIAKSTKETGARARPDLLACLNVVAFFDIWTGQSYTWDVAVLLFWIRNWPPRLNKCASVRSLLSSNSCQERTWLKDIMLTSNGCWDHLLRA